MAHVIRKPNTLIIDGSLSRSAHYRSKMEHTISERVRSYWAEAHRLNEEARLSR